ncbi:MAG: hypothetical protein HQK49_22810 [Oligoflexia bacterium]|nr:hypothetical protein [Oligoflexia bacterium]
MSYHFNQRDYFSDLLNNVDPSENMVQKIQEALITMKENWVDNIKIDSRAVNKSDKLKNKKTVDKSISKISNNSN